VILTVAGMTFTLTLSLHHPIYVVLIAGFLLISVTMALFVE
jgi:hypothetical protein